jgi:hypothetical protein
MHIADKMSVDLCYVDRRVHEPTGDRGLFRRCEWDVRRQLEVPCLETVRMTTGQAKPPLRSPDFEGEASIPRRYAPPLMSAVNTAPERVLPRTSM